MPPYLRVVEESAWENSWNSRPICSSVMPMPVSVTAMVIQSRPSSCCACAAMVTVPFSVNLLALLARLSSACRNRVWSAWIVPRSGGQSMTIRLPFFAAIGSIVLATSAISGASANDLEVKLHAPRLDLRQVEDVVDQREQVAARAEHAIERLEVLLRRLGILPQHLGDADDGVERRAQLVAHVGEELRLVLARLFELAAFVLDLLEQAHVLDGDRRLVGEGGDSSICLSVKGAPRMRANPRTPIGTPSRSIGTPSAVRTPPSSCASVNVYSGSANTSAIWTLRPSSSARPLTLPRSGSTGMDLTRSMNSAEKP